MPILICVGGEKDGLEVDVAAKDRPDVYYALPNLDEEKLRKERNVSARQKLREQLAVLAYRYDPEHSSKDRFQMVRSPDLDRAQ